MRFKRKMFDIFLKVSRKPVAKAKGLGYNVEEIRIFFKIREETNQ